MDAARQSVLLDVSDEIREENAAHTLYYAILREEPAISDENDSTVEDGENVSGGEDFVSNV